MRARETSAHSAILQRPFESSGWGPWPDDMADPGDGPGLLVSPMFWLGGAVSLALWGCVTLLALQWL